jgi:hypothetical protein
MSAVRTISPCSPAPAPVPVVEATQVIETVGVEVLEQALGNVDDVPKGPANGNDVIPFTSTLRRVG